MTQTVRVGGRKKKKQSERIIELKPWIKPGELYPESSRLLSSRGSTGRSRRWGCRCRCWCRGRSRHRPCHTCRSGTLRGHNKEKQKHPLTKHNPDPRIITHTRRRTRRRDEEVKSINMVTPNLDTLSRERVSHKQSRCVKGAVNIFPLMDDIVLSEWT